MSVVDKGNRVRAGLIGAQPSGLLRIPDEAEMDRLHKTKIEAFVKTIQNGISDEFFRVEKAAGESNDAVSGVVAHHIGRQSRPKKACLSHL